MMSSFASSSDRASCGLSLTMSSARSSYSLLVKVTAVFAVLPVALLALAPAGPAGSAAAALLLPVLWRLSTCRGVPRLVLLPLPTAAAAAVAAATADCGVEPDRFSLMCSCGS